MSWTLSEMLADHVAPITIVDVGALWIGDDHVPYRALLGPKNRVVGFEPSAAACEELRRQLPGHTFLPYAVGDGSNGTFRHCEPEMTSSLYEPDRAVFDRFEGLKEMGRVRDRSPMATRRLDDIPEVAGTDFLKLDVQGAELDVCRGARRLLDDDILVVHTEVEFIPLYAGQPLFADIDRELRDRGFLFHRFTGAAARTFLPLRLKASSGVLRGQFVWADAVFVKSFLRFEELSPEALLKIAVIAHDVYSSPDLAGLALQHHDEQTGADLWHPFMLKLTGTRKEKPPLR